MMLIIWSLLLQAAAKREEKMANFVQLLTDGVRTTDWLEVFFCKPAPSSCLHFSEGNKDLRVGNDNRQQQQLRREVCLSIHC